jgi:hypothetical protein
MQDREMQGGNKQGGKAKGAMARLAKALSDPEARKSFKGDPGGTVQGYESLPESVRQTLEGLSDAELDLLGRTHQTFADAGFYVDIEDEYGGGRLGFF